jgi:hypothetical protein
MWLAGMLETTRIRREGYAVRPKFSEFIERFVFCFVCVCFFANVFFGSAFSFHVIAFGLNLKVEPIARNCIAILERAKITGWLMGLVLGFFPKIPELNS